MVDRCDDYLDLSLLLRRAEDRRLRDMADPADLLWVFRDDHRDRASGVRRGHDRADRDDVDSSPKKILRLVHSSGPPTVSRPPLPGSTLLPCPEGTGTATWGVRPETWSADVSRGRDVDDVREWMDWESEE